MDDYTAWVTRPTAAANHRPMEAIVERALGWERRSGAPFKGNKTSLVHFTRDRRRTDAIPVLVKREPVTPKNHAKVLGVTVDSALRFREHIANAATKGLNAAMALKRLRMTSPSTARQLFGATVCSVVNYASIVWSHSVRGSAMALLNRVQEPGAQAIAGMFRTVATVIGEAEASISTVFQRHQRKASSFLVNVRTLGRTNPVARLHAGRYRISFSLLQRIAGTSRRAPTGAMEVIEPYAVAPREARVRVQIEGREALMLEEVQIATSSSAKNGMVGMGGAFSDTPRSCSTDLSCIQ